MLKDYSPKRQYLHIFCGVKLKLYQTVSVEMPTPSFQRLIVNVK